MHQYLLIGAVLYICSMVMMLRMGINYQNAKAAWKEHNKVNYDEGEPASIVDLLHWKARRTKKPDMGKVLPFDRAA